MGSNPGLGKEVFSVGFFLLLPFLDHGTISVSRVSHVVPLKNRCISAVGLIPGRGKDAIEINLSLREEISMKKSL